MNRIAAAVATIGIAQALERGYKGHAPVKRSYDSVVYHGKNGKDFGFGETIGTHKHGPGFQSSSVSSSYSSHSFDDGTKPGASAGSAKIMNAIAGSGAAQAGFSAFQN